jgi:TP901 family phage tail tape measure protein
MQRFGRAMKRGLKIAALAAAAGLALAARSVIKSGMEFEQAITNVGAVSLKTRDQIGELEAQAKELGRTTQFTATQSAQAMEILAKAGFTTNQILAATPAVLSAAAASGLEMAEVAGIVSNSLKGFGLDASNAADIADVLALASSKTNSTIGTLGQSLANVSATARQLNVPLNDAVTAVALLQDVGLDASVAGSSLNTMMTKLGKITPGVAKQLKKAGVEIRTAEGNMLPLPELLQNFAKGAQQVGGDLDVVGFFADLVGLRGQKAALALQNMAGQGGKFEKLNAELARASGAAEQMAKIRMDTLQGDVTKLGSALEGLKIDIFDQVDGNLRSIVQNMTKWVNENNRLIVAMASDPFGLYREAVNEVTRAIEDTIRKFNALVRGLAKISGIAFIAERLGFEIPQIPVIDAETGSSIEQSESGATSLPQVAPPADRAAEGTTREEVGVELRVPREVEATPTRRLPKQVKIRRSGDFQFAD